MMERNLFYGIEKVVREIVYGYLYKRDVFDGKKYTKGFMYGDALVSTAIIMFILPVILSVFWMATLTIYKGLLLGSYITRYHNICRRK